MSNGHQTINISTVTILKIVLIGLALWFLWVVRDVVLILLISVIIASAIDPLADALYRRRVPRALSVLFVYVVVSGLFVLVGFLLVPAITQQFSEIKSADVYEDFSSRIGGFRETLGQSNFGLTVENKVQEFINSLGGTLFQTTKGIFSGVISFITILVISFYLTVEENGLKNFIKQLAPFKHQAYVMSLTNKIQKKMGAWVLGQVILSAVIFGLVFIGLTVLKVKYALVLALLAGLLEIIPYIGPFVSGTIATFFAFLQSPALALAVIILWVVTQQLESNIIVPIVMSKSVGLNPVMVILGILVGGSLGGIIGILLAVPVLSGISVFVTDMMEGNKEAG